MYQEYCYDNDFNFYHYKNNKLTKITRKLYKEKTGESDYIINKLRNSRWKYQENDYFFLKKRKYYWPIDWKLFNLIKYFSENGIQTSSLDQDSYISIDKIDKIIELFGRENIEFRKNDNFKVKDKIIILSRNFGFGIVFQLLFNNKILKFMYKKLNLKIAKQSEAHKGRRMVHPGKLKELLK